MEMTDEPQNRGDQWLKAYARWRRAAADPIELHPATRRLLQGEAARVHAQSARASGTAEPTGFLGRWAFNALVTAAVGVVAAVLGVLISDAPLGGPSKFAAAPKTISKGVESEVGEAETKTLIAERLGAHPQGNAARDKRVMVRLAIEELRKEERGGGSAAAAPPAASSPAGVSVKTTQLERPAAASAVGLAKADNVAGRTDDNVKKASLEKTSGSSLKRESSMTSSDAKKPAAPGAAFKDVREWVQDPIDGGAGAKMGAEARGGGIDKGNATMTRSLPAPTAQEALARAVPLNDASGPAELKTSSAYKAVAQGEFGIRLQQDFSQLPLKEQSPYRRTLNAPGESRVLMNFQIDRQGERVRVVDGDGSVYLGNVLNAPGLPVSSQTDTPAAPTFRAPVPNAPKEAPQALRELGLTGRDRPDRLAVEMDRAGGSFNFQVIGTNRSLRQRVVFEGDYFVISADPAGRAAGATNIHYGPAGGVEKGAEKGANIEKSKQYAPAAVRVQGRAVIGGNRYEVDAVPVGK